MAVANASSVEFWQNRYDKNNIGWHINDVHPILRKYLPILSEEKSEKKIFIPLCGKTKDIPYLLREGHSIFGIEGVAQAVEELGTENDIPLEYHPETSTYETKDKRLIIYCGDFFKCPIENWGPFDAIWDRGSFIALSYATREEYSSIMRRSVAISGGGFAEFKYLLQTVRYNRDEYPGPPHAVHPDDMQKYFEPWCAVEKLESGIIPEDSSMRKVGNNMPAEAYDETYLLKPKL